MVQFRREGKSTFNNYWKLDSGERWTEKTKEELLQILTTNDRSLKAASMTRLRELFVRQQRGLLSYEGLTVGELRSFVVQRGLSSTSTARPTAATLKARLEQADEDATFDRFSELPPEIRQQIFEQYFDSLNKCRGYTSRPGGQPPIALASRQTRLEALPLYYSCCLFRFRIVDDWPDSTFDCYLPVHRLARVRLLDLYGFRCHYKLAEYTISISVNLNDENCSTKISKISSRKGGKAMEIVATKVNRMLMQEPHAVIRRIASRPGSQKLRRSDMSELRYWLSSAVQRAVS